MHGFNSYLVKIEGKSKRIYFIEEIHRGNWGKREQNIFF